MGLFRLGLKLTYVDNSLIEKVVPEIRVALIGLAFREIIQLGDEQFVLAFEGEDFRLLFISIESRDPRIYLIKRRLRDLKKQKTNPSKFVVDVSRILAGSRVLMVEKADRDRVVKLRFDSAATVIVQLTGKSSNLFLLDCDNAVIGAARKPGSDEQAIGKTYFPPKRSGRNSYDTSSLEFSMHEGSVSEFLDSYFELKKTELDFENIAAAARKTVGNEINKLRKLIRNLEIDREQHGDAETWKRYGDLLLANSAHAERKGNIVSVTDVFEPSAPQIEIKVDESDSIAEAAQKYFRKYTKSRNAVAQIETRIRSAREQIESAERRGRAVEDAITREDVEFLRSFAGKTDQKKQADRDRKARQFPSGIRSFVSSDGFEVLVGKKATDNDVLSFKIANSRDLWMHAADYPGSHVLIRNPGRKEIPQKTLLEAAQLAAFYSQGKKQTKAAVHYTEKKFVNKPKGAAPGLVRLASFRTLIVEPMFPNVKPI